jgi:hypothetical protein
MTKHSFLENGVLGLTVLTSLVSWLLHFFKCANFGHKGVFCCLGGLEQQLSC